jgi:tRNA-splicing ligase RtcB
MGTSSYVLAGARRSPGTAFGSACHGAGRALSRHEAAKRWHGRGVIDELAARGIEVRSPSTRGVAEEAPGAYKDVTAVVDASERAGLARKVARLVPLVCIKGVTAAPAACAQRVSLMSINSRRSRRSRL